MASLNQGAYLDPLYEFILRLKGLWKVWVTTNHAHHT